MRLFTYKMTHDTGFAPNPFWGFLTLTTCKPKIREYKRPGDWIAGFTSKTLCGDQVGEERLAFLMQVGEKIALADYINDTRFQSKIPREPPAATVHRCGDNIYRPLVRHARDARDFIQLPNRHHGPDRKDHDLSGRNALIASRFAYFGQEALPVPPELRPNVPAGQSGHGTETRDLVRVTRFIDYFLNVADAPVMARPHRWPRTDASWKTHDGDAPEQGLSETDESSPRGECLEQEHGAGLKRPETWLWLTRWRALLSA